MYEAIFSPLSSSFYVSWAPRRIVLAAKVIFSYGIKRKDAVSRATFNGSKDFESDYQCLMFLSSKLAATNVAYGYISQLSFLQQRIHS